MAQMQIGQALQQLMKSANWTDRINAIRVSENWESIMGKMIAKYTDKVVLKDGVLTIHTSVAPLKQELHASREQIIQRVNAHLKSKVVQSVVIR